MPDADPRKPQVTATLIQRLFGAPRKILCVGCGSGVEVGQLATVFGDGVIGIDYDSGRLDVEAAKPGSVAAMDGRALIFEDASFDIVYSFHALEHIPEPERALSEMARVLKRSGGFLVGTPNKTRVIGYIGTPMSLAGKVRSNLDDFGHRLSGRWSNELGAHAGFSITELMHMCRSSFGEAANISRDYYAALYPNKQALLRAVSFAHAERYIYPAIYIAGHKR